MKLHIDGIAALNYGISWHSFMAMTSFQFIAKIAIESHPTAIQCSNDKP
jgi:hypothetical protein